MITRQILRPLSAASTRQLVSSTCSVVGIVSSLQAQPSTRTPPHKRSLHTRPKLNYDLQFEEKGVTGLFTPNGFKLGWLQYQDLVIEKLNQRVAALGIENKKVKDLVLRFAHDPNQASIFNHASMAHNNHFFYEQFSIDPRQLDQYPTLYDSLTEQFGSIDALREDFTRTAEAMFGPGFVWLVWARDPDNLTGMRAEKWRIMCTYNAGTPYPEAGFMQQGLDMNTNNQQSSIKHQNSNVGYFGRHSGPAKASAKLPPGGTSVMPALCVSLWEHTYIYDHGLSGKEQYLDNFWNAIDWEKVENRVGSLITSEKHSRSRHS